MIRKHYTTENIMENPWNLKVVKLHDSTQGEVLHLTLTPGESMLRHIPPVDILLYVLQGRPTVESGSEKTEVETGSYIESPKGSVMCVYNESEEDVRILIIKLQKTNEKPEFVSS